MKFNKKVFLLPDRLAHYREPVFLELAKKLKRYRKSLYLFYDPKDFYITGIPIPKLDKLEKYYKIFKVKNFYLGKTVLFQLGIIRRFILHRPQILIAWGESHRISTLILLLLSKLLKVKVVLWSHGFYGNETFFKKKWRIFFYKLADKLLIYGHFGTSISRKFLPKKEIFTIGNSILLDKSKFEFFDYQSYKIHKKSIFEKYGLNNKFGNNIIIISFVGRLTKAKSIDLIIKLLSREDASKLFFMIIGSGDEYKNLYDLANKLNVLDKIHFFGKIYNQSEIKSILSISDIFVCPRNLGLSVCTALSAGIPIITTKNMKIQMPESECLLGFEYADFVDFEDQELLLDKINIMYKKIKSDTSSKMLIVEHFYRNFDPEDHATRIIKALNDILIVK
tara:strand:- start:6995 stop:8173 length:1179 start_codon:yes stop_codon:yes gene_type:complete